MYAAITINENFKYYSYAIRITSADNVLSKLAIKNILHANIFTTKKEAEEIVKLWNESYKKNGTYLFDTLNKTI